MDAELRLLNCHLSLVAPQGSRVGIVMPKVRVLELVILARQVRSLGLRGIGRVVAVVEQSLICRLPLATPVIWCVVSVIKKTKAGNIFLVIVTCSLYKYETVSRN